MRAQPGHTAVVMSHLALPTAGEGRHGGKSPHPSRRSLASADAGTDAEVAQ